MTAALSILPVNGMPEVKEGDHIATMLCDRFSFERGDVVVIASKIIAKAEGQTVECDRDDVVKRESLITTESRRILRKRGSLLITETRHGFICANAGVDFSNVEPGHALLLPRDPDRAAFKIRQRIGNTAGVNIGVVVSDTFGRAWRGGVVDVALGCSGIRPIVDLAGSSDDFGSALSTTQVCIVDEIASAAELVMGKTRRIPAAVIRGIDESWLTDENSGVVSAVVRSPASDLFR